MAWHSKKVHSADTIGVAKLLQFIIFQNPYGLSILLRAIIAR